MGELEKRKKEEDERDGGNWTEAEMLPISGIRNFYVEYDLGGIVDALACARTSPIHLTLNDCRLGAAAIELIATALESNALLKELFIRGIGVDVAHMRRIFESLERNTNLRSLAIADCRLSSEEAKMIPAILMRNTTLTSLTLSVDSTSPVYIAAALTVNSSVESLNLSYSHIQAEGAKNLADALARNSSLTSLTMTGIDIDEDGEEFIEEALVANCSLTFVDVSVSRRGGEQIQITNRSSILRNILLSELNFASAMAAAAQRIVVMTSPRFTALSFLGDGRRPFLEGYISNAIRASLSYAPLLAEHRSCRPDPFLTLDLVTQTSNSDLFEVSPPDASWTQGAAAAIPVLACSVKIANIMCLPGACLVIAVDLSEPASSLSRFGRLCATVAVPHVVVFSGADSVTRKGMRRQSVDLRALFPMAADVVDVVQCVPTLHSVLGPPRLVPASWLLFHRELLRSDAVVLSWPAVVALARRCGVFDPDHVLGSVQLHAPSVVLPGRFVIASVPRLREVLTPAFDPVPNILWLPERVRRTAASLLTRSLLCGVDIVHIFRHFVERSAILDDDTILTILDLFAYIHSVGSGLFAVRTASQPASNLAVYARLLQHPEMFQMVDARCDRRLHFQHNEIRFIAWVNENSGELIVDSIEATAEQLTAVRSKLIHADMG